MVCTHAILAESTNHLIFYEHCYGNIDNVVDIFIIVTNKYHLLGALRNMAKSTNFLLLFFLKKKA